MKKLAIISTHPIQYYAPWFRLLAQRGNIELKVFYTWSQAKDKVIDRNFGRDIKWDIPLLEGYAHEFVNNVAKAPGTHHFFGIRCPELVERIEQFMPNALLVFGWNFVSHLQVLRHFKGKVPVWFRGDSTLLDEVPGIKTRLRRWFLTWVYTHVDKAFYVGKANKAYYLKHGLKPSQLIYAPHAIDNDRFSEPDEIYRNDAENWRSQLGYDQEDVVVLFVGKFESKKQPLLLLEAIIEANKHRVQPLKVLFVGNGILEAELQQKSEHHPFVQFLPFQNQSKMPVVYSLGDVLCLPLKGPGETWGLAVNEAMACGIPVIVSNKVGCCDDLVTAHRNGYVFDISTTEQLCRILEGLEKSQLSKMGLNARESITQWRFEAIVAALENAMQGN